MSRTGEDGLAACTQAFSGASRALSCSEKDLVCFTVTGFVLSQSCVRKCHECGNKNKLWRFFNIQSGSLGFFKTKVTVLFVLSDIMKSKSNPDFLKKDRSCVSRQLRNIRSKVSLASCPQLCGALGL